MALCQDAAGGREDGILEDGVTSLWEGGKGRRASGSARGDDIKIYQCRLHVRDQRTRVTASLVRSRLAKTPGNASKVHLDKSPSHSVATMLNLGSRWPSLPLEIAA